VCVFHAKPGEKDFRVSIRVIVMVAVRIKEQVWRLKHKDATAPKGHSACEVQSSYEITSTIDPAVSIDVLEYREAIRTLGPARWWLWHAIIDRPRVSIDRDPFQPGRVGVLQVLNDPQPPPIVEVNGHRLSDQRL